MNIFFYFLNYVIPVSYAVCPMCTVAVGTSLGIFKLLGIDEAIAGIWFGGLLYSFSIPFAKWISKKIKISYDISLALSFLFIYGISLYPLLQFGWVSLNEFFKLLIGVTSGTIGFIIGDQIESYIRSKNNGHIFMYYQKVLIPVSVLTFLSLLFFIYLFFLS